MHEGVVSNITCIRELMHEVVVSNITCIRELMHEGVVGTLPASGNSCTKL